MLVFSLLLFSGVDPAACARRVAGGGHPRDLAPQPAADVRPQRPRVAATRRLRYALVTAVAQGTSYSVFSALVLTVLGVAAAGALLIGAVCVGAFISYNGHRLFAFAPRAARVLRQS